MSQR
ncbi:Protein of unknown function [Escherichia coli D6-113.11]|jgi:hypothetical protein